MRFFGRHPKLYPIAFASLISKVLAYFRGPRFPCEQLALLPTLHFACAVFIFFLPNPQASWLWQVSLNPFIGVLRLGGPCPQPHPQPRPLTQAAALLPAGNLNYLKFFSWQACSVFTRFNNPSLLLPHFSHSLIWMRKFSLFNLTSYANPILASRLYFLFASQQQKNPNKNEKIIHLTSFRFVFATDPLLLHNRIRLRKIFIKCTPLSGPMVTGGKEYFFLAHKTDRFLIGL